MKKFISTFCSNRDAFFINFLQEIDVYHESNQREVYYCDTDWRGAYNKSCLVAMSRFYASNTLEAMLASRKDHDALLIHGTWQDLGEHSWWDYLHETFRKDAEYTFEDETWYHLHGREETRSEFGISLYSLKNGISEDKLDSVIFEVYHSVTPTSSAVAFNHGRYEKALLSLKGQSILEESWDSYPELLSGLTAAKYIPGGGDVPFTFAVLITLCELLRLATRAHITERWASSEDSEVANQYRDLLEIGDNLMGGNW